MADYVSILNKAIGGLGENSAENRQLIYSKARGAIDRKLRAMDPVPSEDAIAGQMAQLENAIDQVEGEHQLASASAEPAPEPKPEPAAPPSEPPPAERAVAPVPADEAAPAKEEEADKIPAPPAGFIDDIILIDGIGEKTSTALQVEGVTGLSQIVAMSDAELAAVTEKIGSPGFEKTQEWKQQASEMLAGALPRSKTDQERLKKLQEERAESAPAPEAAVKPPAEPAREPKVEATESESPAKEERAEAADTKSVVETPVAPPKPDAEPVKVEPTAPKTPVAPAPPVAEPVKEAPAEKQAPPAEKSAAEQTEFADTIAKLTGSDKQAEIPSAPAADPVAPAPETPSPEKPALAPPQSPKAVGDAPPFVGQLEGDPLATPQGEQPVEMQDPAFDREPVVLKPKRSLGKNLGCLAMLALLAGGAYYGWQNQDQVKEIANQGMSAVKALMSPKEDVSAPSSGAQDDNQSSQAQDSGEKDTTRLGSDGDDATDQGDASADQAGAGTEQPADAGETDDQADTPRNILEEANNEPDPPATVEVEGQEEPIAEPADEGQSGDSTTDNGQESSDASEAGEGSGTTAEAPTPTVEPASAPGESAFLYEESVGSSGANRDEGGIVWTLASEAPETGAPAEAVIKGAVDIPGRGLKLNMTIKRNLDPGLPASHLIEMFFTAPAEFSGGNIDNISRFVMKSTEQARGESLVGVPARIDTGFFLIALNNLDQARQTNTRLLESGEWIDIPVAYVTGRRGLITLSKGETGKRVFADALADWRNR